MKTGDIVRIIAAPPILPDDLETRDVFARCVGRTFPVIDIRDDGQAELEVGAVMGVPAPMHSIWIEPECVEVIGVAD
jgi:hypothetical protein